MATISAASTTGGHWNTPGTWTGGVVPGTTNGQTDTANIGNGKYVTFDDDGGTHTIGPTGTAGPLTIKLVGTAKFAVTSTVTTINASLWYSGNTPTSTTLGNSQTLTINGIAGKAAVQLDGGIAFKTSDSWTGSLVVNPASGQLAVNQTSASDNTVLLQAGTQTGVSTVAGTVTLNGSLSITGLSIANGGSFNDAAFVITDGTTVLNIGSVGSPVTLTMDVSAGPVFGMLSSSRFAVTNLYVNNFVNYNLSTYQGFDCVSFPMPAQGATVNWQNQTVAIPAGSVLCLTGDPLNIQGLALNNSGSVVVIQGATAARVDGTTKIVLETAAASAIVSGATSIPIIGPSVPAAADVRAGVARGYPNDGGAAVAGGGNVNGTMPAGASSPIGSPFIKAAA